MTKKSSTSKGKEFEQLVTLFQEVLTPEGWKITWDDSIVGNISGRPRQIDISLKCETDELPVLFIIECRDRGTEDITWIDSLIGKGLDVGANRIIAVSSKGFSAPSYDYASNTIVELRTLHDISPDEILDWVRFNKIRILNKHFTYQTILFDIGEFNRKVTFSDEVSEALKTSDFAKPLFRREDNEVLISFHQLWSYYPLPLLLKDIVVNSPPVEKKAILVFDETLGVFFQIMTSQGWKRINRVLVKVDVQLIYEERPVKGGIYSNDATLLVEGVTSDFSIQDEKYIFTATEDRDGNRNIRVASKKAVFPNDPELEPCDS